MNYLNKPCRSRLLALLAGIAGLSVFVSGSSCMAQQCNGSFGDPVINITFGAGSSTHSAPLGGVTNYFYTDNDFPQDGFYTIENTTAGVGTNGNIWWPTTDHTGDKGGYMMIINATLSPTDYFYRQKVTGLCPGTTYEFAAWIVNLLPFRDVSPPDIEFTILNLDGSVLGTDTTGQIPINHERPEWIQYRLVFTTPPGITSVVLKIRDISAGGSPANDLALDDITFRACGPMISSSYSGARPGVNINGCAGDNKTYTLSADIEKGTYKNPVYQWQVKQDSVWKNMPGDTSLGTIQVVQPATSGKYAYRMVSSERENKNIPTCQVASNPVVLNIFSAGIKAAPIISLPEGKKTIIHTLSTGEGLKYKWTPSAGLSNDTLAEPVASPLTDTEYQVVVTSASGCTASTHVQILVIKNPRIPTAFSPNGDGINDTWEIANIERRPACTMNVFNRDGQVLFSSRGYTVPWDGTYHSRKLPAGVYYYILDTHDTLGILSGTITIL